MDNKVKGYISLAMKAGKVKSGELGCEEDIKSFNSKLVILATDASDNTKKKFQNMSKTYKTDIIELYDKVKLGNIIGRQYRSVLSISDEGFANSILKCLKV